MGKIYDSILEKVGGTPLVEISNKLNKGGARVLVKVEFFGEAEQDRGEGVRQGRGVQSGREREGSRRGLDDRGGGT